MTRAAEQYCEPRMTRLEATSGRHIWTFSDASEQSDLQSVLELHVLNREIRVIGSKCCQIVSRKPC